VTIAGAFAAVGVFPTLALFFWPEPVRIRWGYSHAKLRVPLPPLPPELAVRSERNLRYVVLVQHALLAGSIGLLMRWYSVPPAALGIHHQRWAASLGLGVVVGLTYLAVLEAARTASARADCDRLAGQLDRFLARGSLRFWVPTQLLACFAEEFWRAFCLVEVMDVHRSAAFAVAVTSSAFALAHLRPGGRHASVEFGRCAAHAVFGVLLAVMFLWSASIVPSYAGHLLVNLVALYRARRRQAGSSATSPAVRGRAEVPDAPAAHAVPIRGKGLSTMVSCPACGWEMEAADLPRGSLACPACKARLRWPSPSGYQIVGTVAISVLLALVVPYRMGAHGNGLLWYALALLLPLSFAAVSLFSLLRALLFGRKLEIDPVQDSGRILHITGPPDSSSRS